VHSNQSIVVTRQGKPVVGKHYEHSRAMRDTVNRGEGTFYYHGHIYCGIYHEFYPRLPKANKGGKLWGARDTQESKEVSAKFRCDAMLCSNLGNENSNAGHSKCSCGPQAPRPCCVNDRQAKSLPTRWKKPETTTLNSTAGRDQHKVTSSWVRKTALNGTPRTCKRARQCAPWS